MGADIPEAIRHFGEKINFVHFRDVDGDADRFVETWHDEGPTDMHAAMEAYVDAVDDEVPMRARPRPDDGRRGQLEPRLPHEGTPVGHRLHARPSRLAGVTDSALA